VANITKATSLLGYRPKISLEEGIPRAVEWQLEWARTNGNQSSGSALDASHIDQTVGAGLTFKRRPATPAG
jgi:hypothetical protein